MGSLYLGSQKVCPVISAGGGYSEFPSYQVENGVVSKRSGALSGNEFSNITSIGSSGMYNTFYGCTGLTGALDLSALTSIGSSGMYNTFYGCTGLTSVNLSSLTSIDEQGMYFTFWGCTGLTSVDLSSLTSVGSSGMYSAFNGCTGLTSVDLSGLTTISLNGFSRAFPYTGLSEIRFTSLNSIDNPTIFSSCFGKNDGINIYFPSLTTSSFGSYTNQFNGMLSVSTFVYTNNATIHFPSNLQTKVSSLSGYPNFGGSNTTIAFDLAATE